MCGEYDRVSIVFFFFQAEDGIRDLTVTGVQTCALPIWVSKYQSGKGPGGHGRLGVTTLIKPAKVKVKDHLAELGRIIKRGKALPQGQLIRQLNPTIRGWANYYRVGVSHAVYERLDHLTWVKLPHWAPRPHP